MKNVQKGFTLIELMIVVAIIGILAAIAIPQYSDYTSRSRAAGAASELDPVKKAIALCYAENGVSGFTGCDAGALGVPNVVVTRNIVTVTSVTNGVITVTTGASTTAGTGLTAILTPSFTAGNNVMTWVNSGTSCNSTRGFKPGQGDCA